jgi:hypothetical protein
LPLETEREIRDSGHALEEQEMEGSLTVEALDHLLIHVANVGISAGWHQRALGMERADDA